MPELPEVETIVRTLAPQITGAQVTGVAVLLPKALAAGEEYIPLLTGGTITRVFRRAKLALVELVAMNSTEPLFMAFHLKMTGRFFVHPEGTAPLKHTRLIFDLAAACPSAAPASLQSTHEQPGAFSDGTPATASAPDAFTAPTRRPARLFFDDMRTFGYCRIMHQNDFSLWPFWNRLGPEPLETAPLVLAQRFLGHRKSIKGVLLDQTIVAGVGNIYADESLFQAGILPTATAASLPLSRLIVLAESLQAILVQSIEECGSSIRDYRDANGDAGSFQNSFAVYGRKGEICRRCGGTLTGSTVAGRGTVHCPECQKL